MVKSNKSLRVRNQSKVSVRRLVREAILARQEIKRANATSGNTAWTVAGLVSSVSQTIVQGDTVASRSGDTIRPLSIQLHFTCVTALVPLLGRIILFQDRLNVGVDPTVAQVLDGGAYNSTYTPDTLQQHRFKILYDHVFTSITNTTIVTDTTKIFKDIKIKMKGTIFYNGATNTTSANGPGAVYVLLISDAASGAGGYYNWFTTISYTDS